MKFEEYMERFRLLRLAVEQDERLLLLIGKREYQSFEASFRDATDPVLKSLVLTEESLRDRLRLRKRLCERYAARIAAAVMEIDSLPLREYATYRYLYGLTQEGIADQSYFSVRTVYRHAKKAKEALKKALLRQQPKAARGERGIFRLTGGKLPSVKKRRDRRRGKGPFSYTPVSLRPAVQCV